MQGLDKKQARRLRQDLWKHTPQLFLSQTQMMIKPDIACFKHTQPLRMRTVHRWGPSDIEAFVSCCQYKAPLSLSIVSPLACSLWLVSNLLSHTALAYFCRNSTYDISLLQRGQSLPRAKSRWKSLKLGAWRFEPPIQAICYFVQTNKPHGHKSKCEMAWNWASSWKYDVTEGLLEADIKKKHGCGKYVLCNHEQRLLDFHHDH